MYKTAILSIGKDRPGIVGGFLEVLYGLGCSIEDSSMTILHNQFAIILIVDVPAKINIPDIMTSLQSVKHKFNLFIDIDRLDEDDLESQTQEATDKHYVITVSGKDKTGIVYHFTNILADYHINITDLSSKLLTKAKDPIYILMIEVNIPVNVDLEKLKTTFRTKSQQLEVDFNMHEVEEYRL